MFFGCKDNQNYYFMQVFEQLVQNDLHHEAHFLAIWRVQFVAVRNLPTHGAKCAENAKTVSKC